jgi:hypothetical protein
MLFRRFGTPAKINVLKEVKGVKNTEEVKEEVKVEKKATKKASKKKEAKVEVKEEVTTPTSEATL